MSKINFKTFLPHIIAIVIILCANFLYFFPQLEGKVVDQGDLTQVKGMGHEIVEYNKSKEQKTLWTNSMFGGMPAYQISCNTAPIMNEINKVLTLGFDRPIGPFIFGMVCFYITLLILGVNPWLSLIGALFFGFTTNNILLFHAGHSSKLNAIMSCAPIIGGLILAFRKKYLIGVTLFTFALALNIHSNHIQMSYYLALTLIFLVLIYFVSAIVKKDLVSFAKTSLFLLLGTCLALASSASRLWTTYEYGQDTMRGKPILEATGDKPASSSSVEGLDYDYAMQWSNGFSDVLASYIPLVVGGGSVETVSKDSPFAKKVGSRKEVQAPTYFGALPFTSGPAYFGAIVVFLFVFGAFGYRSRMKWWLVVSVLFTLILSMGKHAGAFNQFIFDFVPLYNKFRTPNSILSVTSVLVPLLAVLGLSALIRENDKQRFLKPLYYTVGILGGISLAIWLLGGSMFTFDSPGDKNYANIADVLIDQRKAMLSSSAMNTLLLILAGGGLIWAYIKNKINANILMVTIGILGVIDLISVDKRYLSGDDFMKEKSYNAQFTPRPVDTQILQDKDPDYRVYDATVNTFNSASTSYYHKTIGGYHAAKLQRYQDIIEHHISKGNEKVMDMLNTKYYILPGKNEEPVVQQNPNAAGNAWFVQSTIMVDNANAEIDSLNSFNVKENAVVHIEFSDYVQGIVPADSMASIKLTSYNPIKMEYAANSGGGDHLAVFSEVWYGPNKGWQAYIDDKPVDHIRVNYLLRGLKIPAGQHKIVFEFKPRSFYLGETISNIASILLLTLAGFTIYRGIRQKNDSAT